MRRSISWLLLVAIGLLIATPSFAAADRYWRLYFPFGNQAGNEIGITEIQMRTTSGGANQSTNPSNATASSQFDAGYAPYYAFDGNTGTEWVTQSFAVVGAWIQYDFGSGNDKDIVEVTIRSRNSFGDRAPNWVVVQRSPDGVAWVTEWSSATSGWANSTVYTFTKPTTGNGSSYPAWWRVRFPAGPESDPVYTSIARLQLMGSIGGADTITTSGSDGGFPYASTNTNSASSGPNQYVDASTSNRWQSDGATLLDQWVAYKYVDINTYDIQEIVITASSIAGEPDQTPNYGIIESSTDNGATWVSKWYYHQTGTWSSGGSTTFSKQAGIDLNATGGHRCWRVRVDSIVGGGTLPSIAAFGLQFGSGGVNIAPMATATATSTNSGNVPAYALDNQAVTIWQGTSGAGLPQYLTLDFGVGNQVKVDRAFITAHATQATTTAPASGAIQYSDDCSSYVQTVAFSGLSWSNGETKTFTWSLSSNRPRGMIWGFRLPPRPANDNAGTECRMAG